MCRATIASVGASGRWSSSCRPIQRYRRHYRAIPITTAATLTEVSEFWFRGVMIATGEKNDSGQARRDSLSQDRTYDRLVQYAQPVFKWPSGPARDDGRVRNEDVPPR